MKDILLEARAQLAHVRMASTWLDEQVAEYLGEFEGPAQTEAQAQSQADFFRLALHPALEAAIVLAVFSLLEQAIQRIVERHAAYDRKGGKLWARIQGSGALRSIAYLQEIGGEAVRGSDLLRDFDDLRLIRNQLAHRGSDFSSAPPNTLAAAKRHELLNGTTADPHRLLDFMLQVEATLLDALEADFDR